MTDFSRRVGMSKTAVDHGFSVVGPSLDPQDGVAQALMLLASRAVALANASVLLAKHGLGNEALPLLRSLLEIAVHMRWITQDDREGRAREFFQEHARPEWEKLWPGARLQERMRALGLPQELGERVLLSCRDHIWGNAQGLPWGHVFVEHRHQGVSPDDLLAATAASMDQVVKALDLRWPGRFAQAQETD